MISVVGMTVVSVLIHIYIFSGFSRYFLLLYLIIFLFFVCFSRVNRVVFFLVSSFAYSLYIFIYFLLFSLLFSNYY